MNSENPLNPPPDPKTPHTGKQPWRRPRTSRLRVVSLNVMIPNLLTLLSLCAGMTAIRFAFQDQWEPAGLALLAASILDTLDGRAARMLKGSTKLGAELDSLADVVCFGVTPAIMMYLWSLSNMPRLGWMVALLFACCCALRLARFNAMMENPDKPAWSAHFFSGFPAPAAAGAATLPLILWFIAPWDWLRDPLTVAPVMLASAGLMVIQVPTFSFKRIRMPGARVQPAMVFAAVGIACLISAPWWTLSIIMVSYIASVPFAAALHRRYKSRSRAEAPDK